MKFKCFIVKEMPEDLLSFLCILKTSTKEKYMHSSPLTPCQRTELHKTKILRSKGKALII
ncbi:hypothetical protein SLEP1_g44635 [Rubroshorea leprosula]|uniref:Ribosomal protein L33 n=1 Tax=Rubroshorea leprosula TaxID=152421 RepID=A0AAV5LHB3_9ROSI|nr:hypothetical protein SLEP1_g44635 [Rubroshorea leprosula]